MTDTIDEAEIDFAHYVAATLQVCEEFRDVLLQV
jgi:hypothetical protein